MALKASTWALLGPALWIAIFLLVASGKADGAMETAAVLGLSEITAEETSAPPAIECFRVVGIDGANHRGEHPTKSSLEISPGPA